LGFIKPTWRIKMKETRTITIEPDQYKELLEYSQQSGQSVKAVIKEALENYIASSERLLRVKANNPVGRGRAFCHFSLCFFYTNRKYEKGE
jgi:predicted CopG family antitoxin